MAYISEMRWLSVEVKTTWGATQLEMFIHIIYPYVEYTQCSAITRIYIYIHISIYIQTYTYTKSNVFTYIYIYTSLYIYIYMCV